MQKLAVRRSGGWQDGTSLAGLCVGLMGVALGACRSTPAEPESRQPVPAQQAPADNAPSIQEKAPAVAAANSESPTAASDTTTASAGAPGAGGAASGASAAAAEVPVPPGHRKVSARPVAPVVPSPGDPLGGKFSLVDATQGLPGAGKLVAEIRTSLGKLQCDLYEDRAPLTVANFVGLARGLRPFKSSKGEWTKAAGYDGTTFHRVIKGFMIQGGDPAGTGAGEPGYVIPDEIWEGAYHSERGLLCMANRGPNTNGMQFFIMDGSAPHLDNGYTIFGKCGPDAVLDKLASVEVQGDRAVKPPKIDKVVIRRDAAKKP